MPASSAEMTSFYTAFRADDTLVEIIPSFDFTGQLPVQSTAPTGPFKAGMAAAVPLWMALFLQQRSLASICPPAWLNTTNLAEIIAFEKKQVALFPTTDDDDNDDDDFDNSRRRRLPANYYEISKRLTSKNSNGSSSSRSLENVDAIALLVQDLLEIRLDKLRQQFQSLLTENVDTDLTVQVTGIGTQELAMLQNFVTQALADQHFLAKTQVDDNGVAAVAAAVATDKTTTAAGAAADAVVEKGAGSTAEPPRRSRLPLRRFRS